MRNRNVGKTKYKVGDWVSIPLWPVRGLAQVIELRGPLGPGGMQIYRLRESTEWGEIREFEQSEDALEPAAAPTSSGNQPTR
jgi:hypothetical protein